ncbi:sulfate transporter family-domain-containing protein [Cadophora sp. MPI-SDFR-AT-0126]|nr:sulfate transporter family-domain-containing protein [Leotiomycetes sp. MPI-SDFR-AT-0126]
MSLCRPAAGVSRKILRIETNSKLKERTALENEAKSAVVTSYVEEEPSIKQWFLSMRPTRDGTRRYLGSLFPFTTWLLGDAIAGLTVGFVVVPQAMAYTVLAELGPEYGLYTSFIGAALYWPFGISKDIVIGTTAVGSLLIGGVIISIEEKHPSLYSAEEVAKCLIPLSGLILTFLGLFRPGWIIELIPYIPISSFFTSASITIVGTQLPVALGIKGINTGQAPFRVYVEVFKKLSDTQLDATIGLSSILLLYIIREVCAKFKVRQPAKKRLWATISSLRLTFPISFYTSISWLVHRTIPHEKQYWKFRLVGKIGSGFKHTGSPSLNRDIVKLALPKLPAIVIILLIEHIAIAKSFGRRYGYTVIPSQEILAQGISKALGTLLGGYACRASFGASAVLNKAGVRTPLAVFYYIPTSVLAGLIIHAVINLMTSPYDLYRYWQLSPLELLIWIVGVAMGILISLETSIYTTIALLFAVLLIRMAQSHGEFLGQIQVKRVVCEEKTETSEAVASASETACSSAETQGSSLVGPNSPVCHNRDQASCPSCSHLRLLSPELYRHRSDSSSRRYSQHCDRYVAPSVVEWHFAGLHNKWTRKSLAVVGFGRPSMSPNGDSPGNCCPAYSVASLLAGATEGDRRLAGARTKEVGELEEESRPDEKENATTEEMQWRTAKLPSKEVDNPNTGGRGAIQTKSQNPVHGVDRSFFHIDLSYAVDTAIRDTRRVDRLSERRNRVVENENTGE